MRDIVPSAQSYARSSVLRGIKRGFFPEPEEITPDWVERSFSEAGKTLMALRVSGTKPADMGCAWPDVVHEQIEAYGWTGEETRPASPSSAQVEWMDQVYNWLGLLPEDKKLWRKIVGLRGLTHPVRDKPVYSWNKIAVAVGADKATVQRWNGHALEALTAAILRALSDPTIGSSEAAKSSGPSAPKKAILSTRVGEAGPKLIQRQQFPNNKVLAFFPRGSIVSDRDGMMAIVWAVTCGILHAIPFVNDETGKLYHVAGRITILDGGRPTSEGVVADCSKRRHFHPSDVARIKANIGDMLPRISDVLAKLRAEPEKAKRKSRVRAATFA